MWKHEAKMEQILSSDWKTKYKDHIISVQHSTHRFDDKFYEDEAFLGKLGKLFALVKILIKSFTKI
jgi:hypothetical protein